MACACHLCRCRQQDYLRSEVSSSSDAETVRVPFPEVQLEFTMRQDAPGRPVSALTALAPMMGLKLKALHQMLID